MRCVACNKPLRPGELFLFEFSLEEGVKVKDADLKQVGMTCQDLMCVALAIGLGEEE
jgi:hypothetical protein